MGAPVGVWLPGTLMSAGGQRLGRSDAPASTQSAPQPVVWSEPDLDQLVFWWRATRLSAHCVNGPPPAGIAACAGDCSS